MTHDQPIDVATSLSEHSQNFKWRSRVSSCLREETKKLHLDFHSHSKIQFRIQFRIQCRVQLICSKTVFIERKPTAKPTAKPIRLTRVYGDRQISILLGQLTASDQNFAFEVSQRIGGADFA